jgi:hypothetical protein
MGVCWLVHFTLDEAWPSNTLEIIGRNFEIHFFFQRTIFWRANRE